MSLTSATASGAKRRGGSVLQGFLLSTLATLAWQIILLIAASSLALSQVLAAHTRHQRELAFILWLAGLILNLGALYWAFRRAGKRTQDGILAGLGLLFLLALVALWFIVVLRDYHATLGDD